MSNDKLAQALRELLDALPSAAPDGAEMMAVIQRLKSAKDDARQALAAHEAEKQAGPVAAREPMTDEADMFWDEDGERNGVEEIIADYCHGDVVKIDRAKRLPSITVRVVGDKGDYEVIEEPAKSSAPPSPLTEQDKVDAERWRTFIGLDYQVRAEWAANLSLVPVLQSWVDAARAKKEQP